LIDLPSYDDLPVAPGAPEGSSWGVWGPDDVLGCLNLLTPERVRRAVQCVRRGEIFALNWDMSLPSPPLFGRGTFRHDVLWLRNDSGHDEELHGWNTQSSSQWDGFRHIRSAKHGFYNGVDDDAHGVHHWARRGLAGRAVLCDVARWRAAQGRPLMPDEPDPIEPDELHATLDAQGTALETGDVLLVRTGWIAWYVAQDETARERLRASHANCGLRPGRATARTLWDMHIAAIVADNPSLEVWPPAALATPEQIAAFQNDADELVEIFVHASLLPLLGLPIGELWDLEALADDCAADGVYECFFTSAPLNLPAGVASPPNALAFK
jgi:hypothetical protein